MPIYHAIVIIVIYYECPFRVDMVSSVEIIEGPLWLDLALSAHYPECGYVNHERTVSKEHILMLLVIP